MTTCFQLDDEIQLCLAEKQQLQIVPITNVENENIGEDMPEVESENVSLKKKL